MEEQTVEYYAYFVPGAQASRVQFKASCQKGCEPPEHEGLAWVKSDTDFDPGAVHVADGVLVQGALDDRTLEVRRQEAWNRMRGARDMELVSGFTWNGFVFDSGPMSQTIIQGKAAVALRNPAFSVEFTLKDNSTLMLWAADMIGVADALEAFVQKVHAKGSAIRALINSSTQPENISWPAS